MFIPGRMIARQKKGEQGRRGVRVWLKQNGVEYRLTSGWSPTSLHECSLSVSWVTGRCLKTPWPRKHSSSLGQQHPCGCPQAMEGRLTWTRIRPARENTVSMRGFVLSGTRPSLWLLQLQDVSRATKQMEKEPSPEPITRNFVQWLGAAALSCSRDFQQSPATTG